MVDGAGESALRRQVGGQRWYGLGVVARVVGELDGDLLDASVRNGVVQLVDGPLGLMSLVEPDEADTLRQACTNIRTTNDCK